MTVDVVAILQKLVQCASVTPEEGGALDCLTQILEPAGFSCIRLPFSEDGTADVDNLFARFGQGSPHFCFAGHTDVVPPGDVSAWKFPPFDAVIEEGVLYGRGASDMKGPVAGFVAAALDFLEQQPGFSGSISLLITGDEEGPGINGTAKVLDWLKANDQMPDHCLVGEPTCVNQTGDTIKTGRRGSIHFDITATGKQGHVAYPHQADNPLPKLVRLLDRLASEPLDGGNDHFQPSTLAITGIDTGNPATNVIPASARAHFNIRFNTQHSAASLKHWVEQHADQVKAEMGGDFSITTRESADAFLTDHTDFIALMQQSVETETGIRPEPSTSGGTSDARFIKDFCPVIEFGPTNATIHQADECISLEELHLTQKIYHRLLVDYFAMGGV